MEYNKIFKEREDIEEQDWKAPQCVSCKHNQGRKCTYYNTDRLSLPVDMFNCPTYEQKPRKKDEAMKLFNF